MGVMENVMSLSELVDEQVYLDEDEEYARDEVEFSASREDYAELDDMCWEECRDCDA